MTTTVRYKNDGRLRKRWFCAEAMAHPAKLHLGLLEDVVNRYCPEPCVILDPMGGVGSLMIAAQYGHTVVLNEMETHFLETVPKSWAKIRQHGPALGYQMGEAYWVRGDARHLPIGGADAISSSPPYEATDLTKPVNGTTQGNATHKDGLTRRYTRSVDAVITSPPYEGSLVESDTYERTAEKVRRGEYKGKRPDAWISPTNIGTQGFSSGYTRPAAIITSPPFGEAQSGGGIAKNGHRADTGLAHRVYSDAQHNHTAENIGNLKGGDLYAIIEAGSIDGFPESYWKSMFSVYSECLRVLRPGGLMILIVKGFTRAGAYVPLPEQTQKLCVSLGFAFVEKWRRELWSLSFWRILQKRKSPETWNDELMYEHVLVMRKPQ